MPSYRILNKLKFYKTPTPHYGSEGMGDYSLSPPSHCTSKAMMKTSRGKSKSL